MTEAEIVSLALQGVGAILSLARGLGKEDAVISALQASLAVARAQTDRDLDRKHAPR